MAETSNGEREGLIEIVGRAIADDQGEAYAEHMSEYRQYASVAVDALGATDMLQALMAAELELTQGDAHEGTLLLMGIRAAIAKAEGK